MTLKCEQTALSNFKIQGLRHMKLKNQIIFTSLFFSLCLSTHASATSSKDALLNEMIETASACVVASVESVRSERINGRITTLTTFRVNKTAFGNVGQTITVASVGGEAKLGRLKVAEVVAGAPRFFGNQERLLFLSETNESGIYSIYGFNQGQFSIAETGEGEDMVSLPLERGGALTLESALSVISDQRRDLIAAETSIQFQKTR